MYRIAFRATIDNPGDALTRNTGENTSWIIKPRQNAARNIDRPTTTTAAAIATGRRRRRGRGRGGSGGAAAATGTKCSAPRPRREISIRTGWPACRLVVSPGAVSRRCTDPAATAPAYIPRFFHDPPPVWCPSGSSRPVVSARSRRFLVGCTHTRTVRFDYVFRRQLVRNISVIFFDSFSYRANNQRSWSDYFPYEFYITTRDIFFCPGCVST